MISTVRGSSAKNPSMARSISRQIPKTEVVEIVDTINSRELAEYIAGVAIIPILKEKLNEMKESKKSYERLENVCNHNTTARVVSQSPRSAPSPKTKILSAKQMAIERYVTLIKIWPIICRYAIKKRMSIGSFVVFAQKLGYDINNSANAASRCSCADGGRWSSRQGKYVCSTCGKVINTVVEQSSSYNDTERTAIKPSISSQKERKQVNEQLQSIEASNGTDIPDSVYTQVATKLRLGKNSADRYLALSANDVKAALKSLKLSEYYNRCIFIFHTLIQQFIELPHTPPISEENMELLRIKSQPAQLGPYREMIHYMFNTIHNIYFNWIVNYKTHAFKYLALEAQIKKSGEKSLTPQELILVKSYKIAQNANEKRPCERKSFMNTPFILRQIFTQLGLTDYAYMIQHIATKAALKNHIVWYRAICEIALLYSPSQSRYWVCRI